MAPFPESEDMTIKRLMVALRKNDYQLLKMGTYKLHEKFHTGHEFELTDDLRQILKIVEEKQYPPEISDILCSTIKDILSKKAIKEISWENKILPNDSGKNVMPDTLQPGITVQNAAQTQQIQPNQTQEQTAGTDDIKELANIINSNNQPEAQGSQSFMQQPALPEANQIKINTYYRPYNEAPASQNISQTAIQNQGQTYAQQPAQGIAQSTPSQQNLAQMPVQNIQPYAPGGVQTMQVQSQAQMQEQPKTHEDNSVKNVAVFYDDFRNDIDYSKVKDYKNNLNLLFSKSENSQDYNVLQQISSLTHLLDTSASDVDKIISMLTTSKGKVSFITASQSQNISRIFVDKNIDFDIPFVKKAQDKNTAFDLIPMVGSTNIFVCSNCNLRTLKTDFNTRTLSVQCPHCDGAAFPDIYAVNSYNPDCNPVFWHRAFAALIKSQIWILVNPPLDENKEIIFDFIKTAYDVARPKKVYILSRENDKKEFYRQMFTSVDENCIIKHNFSDQDKLCEEFINEEIIKKVFA